MRDAMAMRTAEPLASVTSDAPVTISVIIPVYNE